MTTPSQEVERSLPHDMIAWKAAAEIAQEQCIALTARVRELEVALQEVLPAAEFLAEMWNIEYGSPGDCVALCGIRVCDACGCLAGKIDRARAALANFPKESA